jgi:hypothetical protein
MYKVIGIFISRALGQQPERSFYQRQIQTNSENECVEIIRRIYYYY